MRSTIRLAVVALAAASMLAGCGKAREILGLGATIVEVPTGDPTGGPGGPVARIDVSRCASCHGTQDLSNAGADPLVAAAPPADTRGQQASAAVGAHRKHLVDGALARAVECASCHLVPTEAWPNHPAQRQGKVSFSRLATTSPGAPLAPIWNGASCSATYCHGNFKNGANATIGWTGTAPCGSCHAVSTVNGPGGTHPTGVGPSCSNCHGPGYFVGATPDLSTVDPARHVNGVVDLPAVSCSGCHGDGSRVAVASATATDVDGNPLVQAAPPQDADAQLASTAVGAHQAHVNQGDTAAPGPLSLAVACTACHPIPASKAHSNGTTQVTFGGLAVAAGATPAPYAFTTATCSATYCHGSFNGGLGANPVSWKGTTKLGCTACHAAPPAISATVHHPPNPTCGTCHAGYDASTPTVVQAIHVDGTIQHSPASGCTQCHGDTTANAVANTDGRAAPAFNASAIDAHGNAAAATAQPGIGAHAKHLTGTTWRSAPVACADCHVVPAPGDVTHANGTGDVPFGGLAVAAWGGVTPSPAYSRGANSCASTYCHGNFKNGANVTMTWASANPVAVACGSCHTVSTTNGPGGTHPDITAYAGDCGACHPGYGVPPAINPALHINGQLDGGGEPAIGGTSCAGCHTTIFAGMDGTVAHTTAHRLALDVPADDPTSWTSPLSGVAVASRSCVNMCHGDHPHDLTSPATSTHEYNAFTDARTQTSRGASSTTRTATNRARTDFTAGTGGMCLSCHQSPVDAARPAIPVAGFDSSAHDFVQFAVSGGATYAWQYQLHSGNFDRNCTKCHASRLEGTTPAVSATGSNTVAVHFGDDVSLLAGKRSPAGTPAGFVCYNCHGSAASPAAGAQGNRSGKNIQTQVQKARAHPANADAVHDSVAEFSGATFGDALGGKARHASCLDCHDTHEARLTGAGRAVGSATTGNAAGPALQGAWGVRFGGTLGAFATPTAANFTKTTLVAGTDLEATLCFKCHSGFYGTLPSSPSGGFAETDQAKEFNPANVGFHPVLGSSSATLGNTGNIKAPFTRTSLMTCTDCHESEGATDPNGPHGSAAAFLLKGPNTAWSNTLLNSGTSTGMPNGTFCINCHNQNFSGSRFPDHNRNDHAGVPCMNCHAAIPHGGPRPGMLVAPAGAAAASGNFPGVVAGWDTTAPYSNPGTGSRLYLKSYPTATGSWQQGNCGCNGTNH